MNTKIEYKTEGTYINDTKINDKVFDEELHEYRVIDVETEIDNLCMWIYETKSENDKELMKEDLKYLLSIDDEYVFSSTNDYVGSDNKRFNEIAGKILELTENKH